MVKARFKTLNAIATAIRERLMNDMDLVICIDGEEGSGKSTFAIQLARKINEQFTLKNNVLFAPTIEIVQKAVTTLPKYSPIILDEAVNVAYKMDFATSLSKWLKKFFNLARQENQCVMLLIPNFMDLDSYYRNHRVKMWIKVIGRTKKRGYVVVQLPRGTWWSNDKYCTKDNKEVWVKVEKKLLNEAAKKGVKLTKLQKDLLTSRHLITYECESSFIKLPKKMDDDYKALKLTQKYDTLNKKEEVKENKREIKYRNTLRRFVKDDYEMINPDNPKKKLYTKKEIAKKYGVDASTITEWLKDV